jgi:hypothetical protein
MTYQSGQPYSGRSNRWQDWTTLVLAIWLFISPWVLQFGSGVPTSPVTAGPGGGPIAVVSNAAWNAWVLGVIVFLISLSAISRMEFWQEQINVLLGAWIFAAPWALGFAGGNYAAAAWDHWIVGALIFIVSIWNLSVARRRPITTDMAHAGDKPPPPL